MSTRAKGSITNGDIKTKFTQSHNPDQWFSSVNLNLGEKERGGVEVGGIKNNLYLPFLIGHYRDPGELILIQIPIFFCQFFISCLKILSAWFGMNQVSPHPNFVARIARVEMEQSLFSLS